MDKGKHNHKNSYTFMMIPNNEDQIKTYKFPKWILKTAVFAFVFILILSSHFIYSFMHMKEAYAQKTTDIKTLKVVNNQQKSQIEELQTYTQDIDEKIRCLHALEVEVKDLVGLSAEEEKEEEEIQASILYSPSSKNKEASSRGSLFRSKEEDPAEYDQASTLLQIEKDLTTIDQSLDKEESSFNTLKKDVTKQLHYLAAQPTHWPNNGRISSPFGNRRAPRRGASTFHTGIDIANTYGTPVQAAASGKVVYASWKGGLGYTVILSHGYGFTTLYGHNSSIKVKVGQEVEKGQTIAKLGSSGNSTGPHVHFEVQVNGTAVNPIKYLK